MQIARKLAVTISVLTLALSAGAQDGLPSIWEAAGDGNEAAVKAHLKNGVSPDALEPTLQLTPLMAAVVGGQPKIVRLLLRNKANVNHAGPDGNTALHAAAFLGKDDIVRQLIRGGADVTAASADGTTAVASAQVDWETTQFIAGYLQLQLDKDTVMSGREKAVKHLEKGLAKQARKDVWLAVVLGDARAMKRHARRIDDLDTLNNDGFTMLSIAALFGHDEVAEILLKAGANPSFVNRNGSTALHGAAFFGRSELVQMLLDAGVDVSVVDENGATALEAASADWGLVEFIGSLLSVPLVYGDVMAGKKKVSELLSAN